MAVSLVAQEGNLRHIWMALGGDPNPSGCAVPWVPSTSSEADAVCLDLTLAIGW